jgi:hypothetical protein
MLMWHSKRTAAPSFCMVPRPYHTTIQSIATFALNYHTQPVRPFAARGTHNAMHAKCMQHSRLPVGGIRGSQHFQLSSIAPIHCTYQIVYTFIRHPSIYTSNLLFPSTKTFSGYTICKQRRRVAAGWCTCLARQRRATARWQPALASCSPPQPHNDRPASWAGNAECWLAVRGKRGSRSQAAEASGAPPQWA